MSGLMEGYTVLDLTWGLPGPAATMLLADCGANVVRIESPHGDPMDGLPPYRVWNRGKKSVILDLEKPEGREILFRLADDADVMIESFRPGKADKLGIGYAEMSRRFPGLVYTSISGYGATSSRRELPGYDPLVLAYMGLQIEQIGVRPGPHFNAFPAAAYGAALCALFGTCVALCNRLATGRGTHVDTSLEDGALALSNMHWGWAERSGAWSPKSASGVINLRFLGLGIVECGDGKFLQFHTGAPGAFQRALVLFGLDDRIPPSPSPNEMGIPLSPEEGELVQGEILRLLKTRPRDEWMRLIEEADIAVMPVEPPGAILNEPQAIFNGSTHRLDDSELGPIKTVGSIMRSPTSPSMVDPLAPCRGQHTREVLTALGMEEPEITRLTQEGVIVG